MSSTARRVRRTTGFPARILGSPTMRSDGGITTGYRVPSWCSRCGGVRRRLPLAVTAHPVAEWTARPPRGAFARATVSRDLLRDRDGNFGR